MQISAHPPRRYRWGWVGQEAAAQCGATSPGGSGEGREAPAASVMLIKTSSSRITTVCRDVLCFQHSQRPSGCAGVPQATVPALFLPWKGPTGGLTMAFAPLCTFWGLGSWHKPIGEGLSWSDDASLTFQRHLFPHHLSPSWFYSPSVVALPTCFF